MHPKLCTYFIQNSVCLWFFNPYIHTYIHTYMFFFDSSIFFCKDVFIYSKICIYTIYINIFIHVCVYLYICMMFPRFHIPAAGVLSVRFPKEYGHINLAAKQSIPSCVLISFKTLFTSIHTCMHTLAQKHLCEFWCGMHLTVLRAKTLQLNLTGAIEWSEVRNLRLKFGWHLTVQLNNNRKHSMTCPPAATWMRPGATLQVQKFASKLPSSWFP